MIHIARALILTALTLGAWLYVVRVHDRAGGCRVTYVYDGDTVAMDCGDGDRTARVIGLDTPETKTPGCATEKAAGDRATRRLRELVLAGEVTITRKGTDKYRRDLIRLRVNGTDVANTLIREGLAVKYNGGTRVNWCERLAG